jgi:hypothetical protein
MALSFLCPHELISEKEQANDQNATARASGSRNRAGSRIITGAPAGTLLTPRLL